MANNPEYFLVTHHAEIICLNYKKDTEKLTKALSRADEVWKWNPCGN